MSEKMIFCLGDGKYESKGEGYQKNLRIFNQSVTEDEWKKVKDSRPKFELPIAKWIKYADMTVQEKKDWSKAKELDGYLKRLSWENAWKEGWDNASQEFKDWVKNLPHFNSELFKEITGLEYKPEVEQEIIELNGVRYKKIA